MAFGVGALWDYFEMRQRLWRALRLVTLMMLAGAGPTMAQQAALGTYSPVIAQQTALGTYGPVLRFFVDELVRVHLLALRCADETRRPGGELYDWDETRATLVASLWASGYPEDFVREIETRLSIQVKQAACDDAGLEDYRAARIESGTLGWATTYLADTGMVIVEPPAEGSWDKIVEAFAQRSAEQQRELVCLGATNPRELPNSVGRWQQALIGLSNDIAARGYPRPDVIAQVEAADANRLWQPAAEADLAALREDCLSNYDWMERKNQLRSPATDLRQDIEAILTPSKTQ